MLTIKNLTNSPYPVVLADGSKAMLPARGVLENVDVHPQHLPLYRSIGYFEITEGKGKPADPLDHDQDGNKGGSKPADGDKDELGRLRAEYRELIGKRPFPGWDTEELQRRIDEALEA